MSTGVKAVIVFIALASAVGAAPTVASAASYERFASSLENYSEFRFDHENKKVQLVITDDWTCEGSFEEVSIAAPYLASYSVLSSCTVQPSTYPSGH